MRKIILILMYTIFAVLGAWIVLSYIDVIANNLSSEGCKELAKHSWNVFNMLTN